MSSTTKALELLSYFSAARPEIGLSQLCRLAGRDKATTYRHLQSLEDAGFVEQNPVTRQYRLGPMLMQLAQMRETTVPRADGARPALRALAEATGETAHVTVLSGTQVYALASCESALHGTRAIIDITTFPLHATASGLCAVAFGPDELFDIATAGLDRVTPNTPTSPDSLRMLVEAARSAGMATADQTFEAEIFGMAAPVYDQTGFAGAVALASVASRVDPELLTRIRQGLITASHEITRNWGGVTPPGIARAWTQVQTDRQALEPAS